jgi:predicted permease
MVDEDFFKSLHIPLLQGRGFLDTDTDKSEKVAIIDELLAKKYFPGTNPVGKRISTNYNTSDPSKTQWLTIVGVVGTIKNKRLSQETTKETVYQYYRQFPDVFATLALKTALPPAALTAPLRAALARVDSEQPLFDIKTMTERVQVSLDDRRTPMLLLLIFAGVALALSAVGIYGVLAFTVAQRTGEMGVRMSLGAQHHDIVRLVLFDGGRLAGIGLALGLVVAIGLGLMMRAQLFGIGIVDPLTLVTVISVIGATALLACWLPARRAARTSPIVALRYE